jgi:multisubunit Na+/H+ antiporter MnhB subunit
MDTWISRIRKYLKQFIELGVLLIGVSVFAEILFGPDVAFFGSQVTTNLITLLNSLGEQGIAALIIVIAVIFTYRKLLK